MSEPSPAEPLSEPGQPVAQDGTVAFLGLGHMGGPMAINLVKAGYTVTGFDVVPAALETARAHGIATADTAVEAVAGAAVVLTMLPSGKHLLDAYRGTPGGPGQHSQPGLLATAAPGTLFLDCSTINVDEAREAAELAAGPVLDRFVGQRIDGRAEPGIDPGARRVEPAPALLSGKPPGSPQPGLPLPARHQ